jgi:hypothetical protein
LALGEIWINDLKETFESSIVFWSPEKYYKQWQEGLERCLMNKTSCLFTNMLNPQNANFLRLWALYPLNKKVFLQEQIYFLDSLPFLFNLERPYQLIKQFETINEEGDEISTWEIARHDVIVAKNQLSNTIGKLMKT